MFFAPIDKMWERVENERQDSDKALFDALLNLGELVVKTVVAGLVAAVDDRNRDQYRQMYRLVRGDGLGEWSKVLEDVLTGPAAQHVIADAHAETRELNQRCGEGTWQYSAVGDMHHVLKLLKPSCEALQTKVAAKKWIELFVQVRNKSRGHGAPLASTVTLACAPLEASLRQFIDHFALFQRSWAYLHRSLSGRYRVTKISTDTSTFDWLKTKQATDEKVTLPDGIYVYVGSFSPVQRMVSDVDGLDFFFPNGCATGKRYELLSYITGTIREADISPFLGPPTDLPESETKGIRDLREEGRCFGNLPPVQQGYIQRERLEQELSKEILCYDRHPVLTLIGPGGIGKTSLALKVLSEVATEDRFGFILWFSARDIDLLPDGPKRVKPDVLTVEDVAKELTQLLEPLGLQEMPSETAFLAECLTRSPFEGLPILFVFDNFETVRAPQDLYGWIDQHVRLPNKVLITTRTRDFKADYPVEVSGMNEDECDQLIDDTVLRFNITVPLSDDYRQQMYRESAGHPYVIKVLLGEVNKTRRAVKVERIVASQDEILNALFERTYNGLSPVAQRLFLTLSSWRSVVPQLAVEAVLLRPQNERMDVERAIEELRQSSLIDISDSEDGSFFLMVPLVASMFGKRKLKVSPWRSAIESDLNLLQSLGVTQPQAVQHGVGPRVERMFRNLAQRAARNPAVLEEYVPIMQFVARKYPPAWLYLSEVLEEHAITDAATGAKSAAMSYLEVAESPEDRQRGWDRLADLCLRGGDIDGEAHALMELCQVPGVSFDYLSDTVNRFNALGTSGYRLDTEEKQLLVRRVAQTMERRIDEGSATDCSRLAWLYRHMREDERARHYVQLGLERDPENEYCDRLARRLGIR